MKEHLNARSGLRIVFFAVILLVLASFANFIVPLIDVNDPGAAPAALWIFNVLSISGTAGLIINVVGLARAGKDAGGYKKAFVYALAALLCSVAVTAAMMLIPGMPEIVSTVSSVLTNLLNIVSAYYMVTTSLKLLAENREKDAVALGTKLWPVYIIGSLLFIVCTVLMTISGMPTNALTYACGVLSVLRMLALAVFLSKAFPRV